MHQPKKWWIGLPFLAGLVYFAGQSLTPQVEADLRSRVGVGLPPSTTIEVKGRDVAVSPPLSGEARSALLAQPGVRRLSEAGGAMPHRVATAADAPPEPAKPAPPSEPYIFTATLGEAVVALGGKLPNAELQKKAIALAAAAGGGLAVSDGTKVDANAPGGDYAAAISAAFDALRALARGKVSLEESRLSIEGQGRANVRAEALASEAKAHLPEGYQLARADVSPGPVSPYVFEAAREGAKATLSGFAPDEETRKRIVEAARRRFFDAAVEDRLVVAQGAPPKFTEAAEAGLTALARLADGKLSMSYANLSLSGAARYDAARADIAGALEARLPHGFRNDARLTARTLGSPLDAAGCRAAFAELSATQVKFEQDESAISEESAPLVDALTTTVLRCQTVPVEVAGHSDNRGIAELNRDRSKRRARLLVDQFLKAGADSFHVWPTGYGDERPIAPNDTDENRARNRRIEFNVK